MAMFCTLWTLRQTTASLATYADVMEWHLQANNLLKSHESVGNNPEYVSAQKMYKKLRVRYVAPMVRNTNTQTLVLIARTICAVMDTEKSSITHNSRKTTAEF